MSDEITLDDAIRGMLGVEIEEEPTSEEVEETEETPEEPTESTEEDEETPGEDEEGEEDTELDAKLAELESKYGKPEEEDPWLSLKEFEQELIQDQAYLEKGITTGLPDIKNDTGKSIYEMQEAQFDEFLTQLDDDGKERLKVSAIQAREQAIKNAEAYIQRKSSFESRLAQYRQANLEKEVVTDIASQLGLPAVVQKYRDGTITKHVMEKAKADPSIAQKAATKEGLYQIAISAIRELNIVPSKDEKPKKPSAPDAKTASKKVKTNPSDKSDEALMAKVSKDPSAYRKLDRETRDRLMYASIKNVL